MVNPVRWAMPDRVLNYWMNTSFKDGAKPVFEALLHRHFAEHGEFVNGKRVMMLEMQDART